MAHDNQQNFFRKVSERYPENFSGVKVLECGSLNVNGTVRDLFKDCDYLGIDIVEGNCVDKVCKTHELSDDCVYDTVISGEMLEHDEFWKESLAKMYRVLKPNGLLVLSCAGRDRPEHGTRNTGELWGTSPDYYKNLEPSDIGAVLKGYMFTDCAFEVNEQTYDTYFFGKRL